MSIYTNFIILKDTFCTFRKFIGDSVDKSELEPIVILAYVDIIRKKKGGKTIIPNVTMEGKKWFPVLLSVKKLKNTEKLDQKEWCVGYMKEECLWIPKSVFEAIETPLRIQGEVMPISAETPFGVCDYSIKIRNISAK